MKKVLTAVLVFLMLISLTACGSNGEKTTEVTLFPTNEPTSIPTPEPNLLKELFVHIGQYYEKNGQAHQKDSDIINGSDRVEYYTLTGKKLKFRPSYSNNKITGFANGELYYIGSSIQYKGDYRFKFFEEEYIIYISYDAVDFTWKYLGSNSPLPTSSNSTTIMKASFSIPLSDYESDGDIPKLSFSNYIIDGYYGNYNDIQEVKEAIDKAFREVMKEYDAIVAASESYYERTRNNGN